MNLSPAAREHVNTIRRYRLTYRQEIKASAEARRHLGLKPDRSGRKLPHLLTLDSLRRFYSVIDSSGNLRDQIMLRLLFFTAIRVHELVSIRIEDVDLTQSKIFIEQGKGSKDRYILFPDHFRLTLQAYLRSVPENRHLFESSRKKSLTTRRVHQIVAEYAAAAEIPVKVHPHLFRHQCLTLLTKEGVPDAQIQLISGHATKQSLEIYQHIGLEDVNEAYQQVMRNINI